MYVSNITTQPKRPQTKRRVGSAPNYPKRRLYFSPANETILQNLEARHNRPYMAYRELMPEVFKQLGVTKDVKVKWSTKAGCLMCPCSPGFIVEGWDPALSGK